MLRSCINYLNKIKNTGMMEREGILSTLKEQCLTILWKVKKLKCEMSIFRMKELNKVIAGRKCHAGIASKKVISLCCLYVLLAFY